MKFLILFFSIYSSLSFADSSGWNTTYSSNYYGSGYSGGYFGHSIGNSRNQSITSIDLDPQNIVDSSFRIASREGRVQDARHLLEQGAEVDSRTSSGETALMSACRSCSLKMIKLLISKSANINARDFEGKTPLILASRESCVDAVDLLLKVRGIEIDARDQSRKSALDYANDNAILEVGGPAERIMSLIYKAKYGSRKKQTAIKSYSRIQS